MKPHVFTYTAARRSGVMAHTTFASVVVPHSRFTGVWPTKLGIQTNHADVRTGFMWATVRADDDQMAVCPALMGME